MTNQDRVKELIELRAQAKLGGEKSVLNLNTKKGNIRHGKNSHVTRRRQFRRV